MNNFFSYFSNDSRVWLYQTNRPLSPDESNLIEQRLTSFVKEWAAHGAKLVGDASILNPCFIAFVVDENQVSASGCSIDSSVRFLKALGEELGVDFFCRNKITLATSPVQQISFHDINQISSNELIYDPLINTLNDLNHKWIVPIGSSNLAPLVR